MKTSLMVDLEHSSTDAIVWALEQLDPQRLRDILSAMRQVIAVKDRLDGKTVMPKLVAGDDLYDFYGRSLGRIYQVKSSYAVNMSGIGRQPTNAIIIDVGIMRGEL